MAQITQIKLTNIEADPNQPRKHFNAEKLKNLKNSISQHGIVNPIIVQELGKGQYLLVDGERRFRAAGLLGLKDVPAIIEKPQKETDRLVRQFNIQEQHESWSPAEKAIAVDKLASQLALSLPAVCKLLNVTEGDTRRYVAFSAIVDKDHWVRNEIPLDYANGISSLKTQMKRSYASDLEEEFTRADEKKVEHRIVELIKTGAVAKRADLSRLKDAFTKQPKSMKEFMTNTKTTPMGLYLSTKAKGAYNLRNSYRNAGYVVYHGKEFLKAKDTPVTDDHVRQFKAAIEMLKELIALHD